MSASHSSSESAPTGDATVFSFDQIGDEASEVHLSPAEIDARHARQLVQRTLHQLERGEQNAASLSCKQAIHLAPDAPLPHSLAGLLALLERDAMAAVAAYESAIIACEKATDCGDAATERERLNRLRATTNDSTWPDFASLVPDVGEEIARLRRWLHDTPLASFLNSADESTRIVSASTVSSATASAPLTKTPVAPLHDLVSVEPLQFDEILPTAQRKRAPAWVLITAAVLAALGSFFLTRALRESTQPQSVPSGAEPSPSAQTR